MLIYAPVVIVPDTNRLDGFMTCFDMRGTGHEPAARQASHGGLLYCPRGITSNMIDKLPFQQKGRGDLFSKFNHEETRSIQGGFFCGPKGHRVEAPGANPGKLMLKMRTP